MVCRKEERKEEEENTFKIHASSPIKDLVVIYTSLCKKDGEQVLAFIIQKLIASLAFSDSLCSFFYHIQGLHN